MMLIKKLKKTHIYTIYRFIKYLIYPIVLRVGNIKNKKPVESGVTNEELDGKSIIVSLTSFPDRIHLVHKAIHSLMNQTTKPNKIILWLSIMQFPNKEKDLPKELVDLMEFGLTIEWLHDDIKSYKKLVPALERYPNDIIVTADDDLYYPVDWLEKLVISYKEYPRDIHCQLVTIINKKEKQISVLRRENKYINKACYNFKILGGSGTLYPPNSLDEEVLKKEKFMYYAPTSDDIWFWGMALKNNTKIRWINNNMRKLYYIENSQEDTFCLTTINDGEEKLFDKHIINVVELYSLWDKIELF